MPRTRSCRRSCRLCRCAAAVLGDLASGRGPVRAGPCDAAHLEAAVLASLRGCRVDLGRPQGQVTCSVWSGWPAPLSCAAGSSRRAGDVARGKRFAHGSSLK
eukprot:6821605-Pyramimonas_sp.AAC.1